jgi:hypothetical protein
MAGEWDSQGEERELFQLLAKAALSDYPNPERIGCPGQEFLRALAFHRKSIPIHDSRLHHVVHCSPCFRELTDIKAAAKRRRNTVWAAIAAAAAVIVIGVALWESGVFARRPSSNATNLTPIIAQINLQNRSITRGASPPSQQNETILVPKGQLKLTILLPFGSEAGTYDVEILKEVDKPLIIRSGQAEISDGVTKLAVSLNTSSLPAGKYLLGIRQRPLDWAFNPITIE